MNNVEMQFINAISKSGITPPLNVIDDGIIHRYSSNGNSADEAGWYVLHSDGIAAGSFGDWRTSESHTWCADIGRQLSSAERTAHNARIKAMKDKREADDVEAEATAKQRANEIWNKSTVITELCNIYKVPA